MCVNGGGAGLGELSKQNCHPIFDLNIWLKSCERWVNIVLGGMGGQRDEDKTITKTQ